MRIPTSVAAFDEIVKGGVPVGSVVILAGEPGSGNVEFAYTSAAKLSMARKYEERRKFFIIEAPDIYVPQGTLYISFSKSSEEILRSVEITFDEDLHKAFRDKLKFRDLSVEYFRNSVVPRKWISENTEEFLRRKGELLREFVRCMEESDGNIVIVDSLTDLVTTPRIDFNNLVDIIRGIRRVAKRWNTVIYLLLTLGVIDKMKENLLFDAVDGVFVFEWHGSGKYSKRYRYMYVLKFEGLMAHLEEERIARFNTTLNRRNGFVVVNTEKIG